MIFVTGGTGMLGAHLLLQLTVKGQAIKALKRQKSSLAITEKVFKYYQKEDLLSKLEWVDGDLLDVQSISEGMMGCSQVYHTAAMVSFQSRYAQKMLTTNVQGTANVVNIALSKKIEKLAHVSSIAALNRYENDDLVTEENYWKSHPHNSNYAISKYLSEQEVWRGTQEGLNAVIINPSIIMGPGDWRKGSSKMFQKVWEGLKYYSNGGSGYVDVVDVASALVQLMEAKVVNERFIINGENINYKTIFEWIAEDLAKPKASIKVNPFLKEIAWRMELIKCIFTRKSPLITKETAKSAMITTRYSNQKICDLGFTSTPIRKSIKKYAEWFLNEN
jgi:nucleoside-diphosphate-sugar epimerase